MVIIILLTLYTQGYSQRLHWNTHKSTGTPGTAYLPFSENYEKFVSFINT